VKRTQIYLDEAQDAELAAHAAATGRTKSDLIRQAIDGFLDRPSGDQNALRRFRAALGATAGAVPRLDTGAAFVDDVRRHDADRLDRLDASGGDA